MSLGTTNASTTITVAATTTRTTRERLLNYCYKSTLVQHNYCITTSATATYNLAKDSVAYTPISAQSLMVSLNGVTQAPIAAYTVSGSTIVFASALTSNDVIDYVIAFEGPKVSPNIDDGSITTAMIADNAITSAKIGVDVIVAEDLAANSVTVSELTDGAITEAKLNIDNTPTNDYVLTAKSSASGSISNKSLF